MKTIPAEQSEIWAWRDLRRQIAAAHTSKIKK